MFTLHRNKFYITVCMHLIHICEYFSLQATLKFIFKILHDQSSAGSRKFVIEPETGVITLQGELDRETTANYTVCITNLLAPLYLVFSVTYMEPP